MVFNPLLIDGEPERVNLEPLNDLTEPLLRIDAEKFVLRYRLDLRERGVLALPEPGIETVSLEEHDHVTITVCRFLATTTLSFTT